MAEIDSQTVKSDKSCLELGRSKQIEKFIAWSLCQYLTHKTVN